MYKYTTPTLIFTLPFEASYLTEAFVTIRQNSVTIEKSLADCVLFEKQLKVTLTQTETGSLSTGTAKVQLRCKGNDEKAYASVEKKVEIRDVLKAGEI